MSYNQRNRTIQLSLVVFCCLFVTVFRGEVSVNSETCIVPHLAPPPKFSWYKNQQVAVRIDDAWSPEDGIIFAKELKSGIKHLTVPGSTFTIFPLFTSTPIVLPKHHRTLRFGGKERLLSA